MNEPAYRWSGREVLFGFDSAPDYLGPGCFIELEAREKVREPCIPLALLLSPHVEEAFHLRWLRLYSGSNCWRNIIDTGAPIPGAQFARDFPFRGEEARQGDHFTIEVLNASPLGSMRFYGTLVCIPSRYR